MTQIDMLRKIAAGEEVTDEMMAIAADMVEKRANVNRKPTKAELERKEANAKVKEAILGVLGAEPKTAKTIAGEISTDEETISTQKASSLLRQLVEAGSVVKSDVKVTGKGTQKGYSLA